LDADKGTPVFVTEVVHILVFVVVLYIWASDRQTEFCGRC
jgi:hypothetical protein